jgi:two-component system sensor histidine kinase DesK
VAGELAGARSVLRAAGVTCTVHGEGAGATLPRAQQSALAWVVREAVTNVLRHSDATSCTITLRTSDGEAELQVVNDGVSGGAARQAGPPGSGLIGLGERLAGAGGALETRMEGCSFVLTATIPGRGSRSAA